MNSFLFQFLLRMSLILVHFPSLSLTNTDKVWSAGCGALINCGPTTGVGYPFWGEDRPAHCGHPGLELDCDDDVLTIDIASVGYRVLGIDQKTKILRIARKDLAEDLCPEEFLNTILDPRLFIIAPGYQNLTFLYGCPPSSAPVPGAPTFSCEVSGVPYSDGRVEVGALGPGECYASVVVPVSGALAVGIGDVFSLNRAVSEGFAVRWTAEDGGACEECRNSSGECGYEMGSNQFTCFCPTESLGSKTCTSSVTNRGSILPTSPAKPEDGEPADGEPPDGEKLPPTSSAGPVKVAGE